MKKVPDPKSGRYGGSRSKPRLRVVTDAAEVVRPRRSRKAASGSPRGTSVDPRDYGIHYPTCSWLLFHRDEISPSARDVYSVLAMHLVTSKSNEIFPSQVRLAEETGLKERMVRYALTELTTLKLIEITQSGRQRTNRYRLLYHQWMNDGIVEKDPAEHSHRLPKERSKHVATRPTA